MGQFLSGTATIDAHPATTKSTFRQARLSAPPVQVTQDAASDLSKTAPNFFKNQPDASSGIHKRKVSHQPLGKDFFNYRFGGQARAGSQTATKVYLKQNNTPAKAHSSAKKSHNFQTIQTMASSHRQ